MNPREFLNDSAVPRFKLLNVPSYSIPTSAPGQSLACGPSLSRPIPDSDSDSDSSRRGPGRGGLGLGLGERQALSLHQFASILAHSGKSVETTQIAHRPELGLLNQYNGERTNGVDESTVDLPMPPLPLQMKLSLQQPAPPHNRIVAQNKPEYTQTVPRSEISIFFFGRGPQHESELLRSSRATSSLKN